LKVAALNEALADELQRQGVKTVFGLLGEDVAKLGVALERRAIAFRSARHESGAIAMADGYARVSGELAVALISRGPGVSNALTDLMTAAKASNPVVVITGDCDPSIRSTVYSKWLDQRALFEAADIPFVTIDSPESAVADLAAAFDWARAGKLIVAQFPGDDRSPGRSHAARHLRHHRRSRGLGRGRDARTPRPSRPPPEDTPPGAAGPASRTA
jgi:acetolactate synthase-1/2/3 large subunit